MAHVDAKADVARKGANAWRERLANLSMVWEGESIARIVLCLAQFDERLSGHSFLRRVLAVWIGIQPFGRLKFQPQAQTTIPLETDEMCQF